MCCVCVCLCLAPQCIEQLTVIQAELQDSVKELSKSRKKYQEAETMAQAVREKTELEAKYDRSKPAYLKAHRAKCWLKSLPVGL